MSLLRGRTRAKTGLSGRFFFLHIQKTGGTALLAQFRDAFPARAIYPNELDGHPMFDGPQFKTDLLEQAWRTRGPELRLVIGHFPYCTVSSLPADFQIMTVLRSPVERTLSFLRHHKQLHPADLNKSLADLYHDEDRFGPLIHNHMVLMLGMRSDEMTDGMLTHLELAPEHLDRARSNLNRISAVGIQEKFDSFRHLINERFQFNIRPTAKVNTSLAVPDDADRGLREEILQDNMLDQALYDHAVTLVRRRENQPCT